MDSRKSKPETSQRCQERLAGGARWLADGVREREARAAAGSVGQCQARPRPQSGRVVCVGIRFLDIGFNSLDQCEEIGQQKNDKTELHFVLAWQCTNSYSLLDRTSAERQGKSLEIRKLYENCTQLRFKTGKSPLE